MIRLPVRVDFAGSWSDQADDWPHPAAVLNAAVGWDGKYPLTLDDEGELHSEVQGIGTGLGISSILAAGKFLRRHRTGDYVQAVLDWERRQGTKGGWQDQIGGCVPGLKLITTADHETFDIQRRDDHPILNHLVLFDTGIRRQSKRLGDRVRELMRDPDSGFCQALRRNVAEAPRLFRTDCVQDFAEGSLAAFSRLAEWVPEMSVETPNSPYAWGSRLVGAGGGGFGIYFCRAPELRPRLLVDLVGRGLWARVPELLPGVQFD